MENFTKKCPACGEVNANETAICTTCGANLENQITETAPEIQETKPVSEFQASANETTAPSLLGKIKTLSPWTFALIIILFWLPFADLQCSGVKLKTFSGIEMAVGTKMKATDNFMGSNSLLDEDSDNTATTKDSGTQKVAPFVSASIALILAIIGLVVFLFTLKNPKNVFYATIAALGALSMIALQIEAMMMLKSSNQEMDFKDTIDLHFSYQFAYWLVLLLFLAVAVVNYFNFKKLENKAENNPNQ